MPKLLTQGVSLEPKNGRQLIGIVAGFKSERWPVIDRNAGRLQLGIRILARARASSPFVQGSIIKVAGANGSRIDTSHPVRARLFPWSCLIARHTAMTASWKFACVTASIGETPSKSSQGRASKW